jgi:hypothetical protein
MSSLPTRSLASVRAIGREALSLPASTKTRISVVFGSCLLALVLGRAVAIGGQLAILAFLLTILIAGGAVAWSFFENRAVTGYIAIEVPALLLCASTLVFRERDTVALADNPLDPAGFFRVLCVGAALMFGLGSLLTPVDKDHAFLRRVTSRPFRLYVAYVFVVFLGAAFSVSPTLTIYRGVELAAVVAVVGGAARIGGKRALQRVEHVLYWFFVALVSSAWIGVILFPGRGLDPIDSPIPYQLNGVFPAVSSNGLGLLGVLLLFWSIGRLMAPHHELRVRPRITKMVAVLGFATLVFAQYRTGYASAIVGLVILLLIRRQIGLASVFAAAAVVFLLWGPSIVETVEPIALRGQTVERAQELSGRNVWWEASIPVWQKSPILGRGLLTGTRFEVLAEMGRGTTSTIHSTWIEALVGTGIVGISLLAAFFLTMWKRSIFEALRPGGRLVPLLIMAIFSVRTYTGTTFEAAGSDTLLFLTIALSLRDSIPMWASKRIDHSPS